MTGLGGELSVLVGGDRVLIHHGLPTHIVSKARPVGVSVGLVEHRIGGTQEPEPSGGRFCGQHAEEATHEWTL